MRINSLRQLGVFHQYVLLHLERTVASLYCTDCQNHIMQLVM